MLRGRSASRGLFDELGRAGFVEGQNLAVAGRGWGFRSEQFPEMVPELVKAKVDVILAGRGGHPTRGQPFEPRRGKRGRARG